MKFQTTVLILATVTLTVISVSEAGSCVSKLKNAQDFKDVQKICENRLKSRGHNISDIPEDLEKNKWDDKCLSNCTLGEMKFFVNMTIQKDAIIEMFNQNAPAEVKEKLATAVNECAKKISNKKHNHKKSKSATDKATTVSPKFNNKKNETDKHVHTLHPEFGCRIAAKFVDCVMRKEQEIC